MGFLALSLLVPLPPAPTIPVFSPQQALLSLAQCLAMGSDSASISHWKALWCHRGSHQSFHGGWPVQAMQSLLPDILAAIIFVDSLKFPLHQIFPLLFKVLLKPILQASLSAFSPSIHPYEPICQLPMPTCPQSNQDIASIPPSLRDPCISLGHSSLPCLSGSVDCSTFTLFLSTDIYNIMFFYYVCV